MEYCILSLMYFCILLLYFLLIKGKIKMNEWMNELTYRRRISINVVSDFGIHAWPVYCLVCSA